MWLSRKDYNALIDIVKSMETRIFQLELWKNEFGTVTQPEAVNTEE